MKRALTILSILGLLLIGQIQVDRAEAQVRIGRAPITGAVAAHPAWRGHHRAAPRVFVYPQYYYPYAGYYPYYPGYGYYPYGTPFTVVSPYAESYYVPPTVVATLPYFCAFHQVGWMTRAGFLDHLAGTHKLLLQSAVVFCPDGAEGCIFPAY